ncbi:MAG: hypothetical protein IJW73_05155 [Candidatus Gastranaerophilales bacterium]|nr:hypothetical protein [Candidatus Gastranaerophilales bacterium]
MQKKFKEIENQLIEKRKYEKINVAFFISLISMFPAKPFFEFLLKQEKYNAKIIILPDLRFGEENVEKLQNECWEVLTKNYPIENIIKIPTDEKLDNINLKEIADIAFFSLPYDISFEKYSLSNILNQGILPAVVNYGYFRSKYDRQLISKEFYSNYWKVFAESKYNLDEYKKHTKCKGKNCHLVGYCKMDDYKNYENFEKQAKKTIMIAPHHSVEGGYNNILSLSNFYYYSDLFLKLPDMYLEINFIFRPHPALFMLLSKEEFWGKKKVENYISQLKNKQNVIYDTKADYFKSFAMSDGIIQDCGSYLVEYFYTGKPQCYMLKNPKDIKNKFIKLGEKCLKHSYLAYKEKYSTYFIDEIIIK